MRVTKGSKVRTGGLLLKTRLFKLRLKPLIFGGLWIAAVIGKVISGRRKSESQKGDRQKRLRNAHVQRERHSAWRGMPSRGDVVANFGASIRS